MARIRAERATIATIPDGLSMFVLLWLTHGNLVDDELCLVGNAACGGNVKRHGSALGCGRDRLIHAITSAGGPMIPVRHLARALHPRRQRQRVVDFVAGVELECL